MNISFSPRAWQEYNEWQQIDKKIFDKIQNLIKESLRNPFGGIGKPEPLRGNLAGFWSKRITQEHRLVYKVENDQLFVLSCRYHY